MCPPIDHDPIPRRSNRQRVTLSLVAGCLIAAVLSGFANSLPISALPTREQIAQPVLDQAEQQKAMEALIKDRDERQAKIARNLETQPPRR